MTFVGGLHTKQYFATEKIFVDELKAQSINFDLLYDSETIQVNEVGVWKIKNKKLSNICETYNQFSHVVFTKIFPDCEMKYIVSLSDANKVTSVKEIGDVICKLGDILFSSVINNKKINSMVSYG